MKFSNKPDRSFWENKKSRDQWKWKGKGNSETKWPHPSQKKCIPLKVCQVTFPKVQHLSQASNALHKTHPAELPWFLSSALLLLPSLSRHWVCMIHTLFTGKINKEDLARHEKHGPESGTNPLDLSVSQDGKVSLYKQQNNHAKFQINAIKFF